MQVCVCVCVRFQNIDGDTCKFPNTRGGKGRKHKDNTTLLNTHLFAVLLCRRRHMLIALSLVVPVLTICFTTLSTGH